MRKAFWIFVTVALLLCLLLLLSKRRHKSVVTVQNAPQQGQVDEGQATQLPPQMSVSDQTTKNSQLPPVASTNSSEIKSISPQLLANWQGPIDFYGKIIDENSNPVEGASIHFQWSERPAENGMRTENVQSDMQGTFSLKGERGLVLTVSVSKVGYYSSRKDNDSYTYGSLGGAKFSPDSQISVIFHLRKKSKGASLIETKFPPGMRIAQLHHDGTPIVLDLLSGSQVSQGNGQLELQLWHDISDKNATKFDWNLQLSVPNGGGLVPTDDEFAFEAPQNGYQPSIVINMPATNQDWSDNFSARYYVQLPNGEYGRFDLNLLAHNGAFTVKTVINPTGSQNLEPAQQ